MRSYTTIGDQIALMHQQHGKFLLQRLMLHGVAPDEAKDLQQDFYLSVLTGKKRCPTQIKESLIAKIALNLARDHFRCTGRLPEFVETIQMTEGGSQQSVSVIDQEAVNRWQQTQSVSERLVEAEHAIELAKSYLCDGEFPILNLLMAKADGFTNKEIAEYWQVSQKTISRWLSTWYAWLATERRTHGGL
jgi:DNA-directed RNA polymerase specialized sigma24 family protein